MSFPVLNGELSLAGLGWAGLAGPLVGAFQFSNHPPGTEWEAPFLRSIQNEREDGQVKGKGRR